MKKLFFTLFFAAMFMTAFQSKANDVGTFYVTCKVQVADDSNGCGTVYINTGDEGQATEQTKSTPNQMPAVENKPIDFTVVTVPAEGYVFANFTDQFGNPHYYSDPSNYTVTLTGYSEDINDPTVYELSAHFVPAGDLPQEDFIEVTISAEHKFGTFVAPVSVELPYGLTAYKVIGVDEDNSLILEELDSSVPAYTAVLIENTGVFDESITTSYRKVQLPDPLPSLTTGLLTGTFEDLEVDLGNYILNEDAPAAFAKLTTEARFIDAYTCYMSVENGQDSYTINTETAGPGSDTGIQEIISGDTKTETFDLNGNRLNRLQTGVNIVNGVKVIVK